MSCQESSGNSLHDYEELIGGQLEPYLAKEASKRPPIGMALNLPLFEPLRENRHTPAGFDPFRIESLADVEQNWPQLMSYLCEVAASENEKHANTPIRFSGKMKSSNSSNSNGGGKLPCFLLVNEKLIDVLLKPFMFFSERVREEIFPAILVPKGGTRMTNACNLAHLGYLRELSGRGEKWGRNGRVESENGGKSKSGRGKTESATTTRLEPFLDADKYKAFVVPRLLGLFSMRSTQIRTCLLEYFPFYVSFITDMDTLKYEVLPEVNYLIHSFLLFFFVFLNLFNF